ncbi:MAG: ABC transporter ATP-binding protein [Acidimicrobiia bacterium]
MTDEAPLLQVDAITRRFGDRVAVNGVSFRIGRGETYGLLGPNGAGKTTTISMVSGILAADNGTITVNGKQVTTKAAEAKSEIGLVPQEIALYPDMSPVENLRFFGRLQAMSGKDLNGRIAEVLEIVGLSDRAKDHVADFSGGMKRRVNIAAGLLHRPRLLILDEPTVGVDPQSRNQILESIEQLGREGLSVLYTTHYMEEAERLCERIGIIDEGRIIVEGTKRDLVERIGGQKRIVLTGDGNLYAFSQGLAGHPSVSSATVTDGAVEIVVQEAGAALAAVVEEAAKIAVVVTGVSVREPDLEAVFLAVTGKALRD